MTDTPTPQTIYLPSWRAVRAWLWQLFAVVALARFVFEISYRVFMAWLGWSGGVIAINMAVTLACLVCVVGGSLIRHREPMRFDYDEEL